MKRLAIVALAVMLGACTNDSTSPGVSLFGTFTLRTINGSQLPFQFSDGAVITSDVVTLNSDGTYTDDAQFSNGAVVVSQGFYSANNGSLQFTDETTGENFTGSLSGDVLTEFFVNGPTEVFQKS
jgi:hypothetical protein